MKEKLRNKYLKIRKDITNRDIKDNIIYEKVINDQDIINSDLILVYVSYNNEVDTLKIINYFIDKKKIAVPRIDNNIMNFYYINSINDLKVGYYGILEPINNNIVCEFNNSVCITPGICFDKYGYRIGYGKGFYDKFFYNHDVFKIGLCYNDCMVNRIVTDEYDIAVNKVITD